MTVQGYREGIIKAVEEHYAGDSTYLNMIAEVLEEQDEAKQALRDKGYGHTGLSLLRTIQQVPRRNP